MLMWNGACIVHDEFKGVELDLLKQQYPNAKVLVHPESPEAVVRLADLVGSTSQLLQAVEKMPADTFIVATDNGILHRMRQVAPHKTLIEAPTAGRSASCKSCAHCPWMAMNAVQGVIDCLADGVGEITLDPAVRAKAQGCIDRMLDFVKNNPSSTGQPRAGFVPHIGAA
jgi:quinolinate synthase